MTYISNPITPVTSELRQDIAYCGWQIDRIKLFRLDANPDLWPALNISLDFWLGKLSEYRTELERIEELKNVK